MPKILNPTNDMRPTEVGAFILPSLVGASEFIRTRRRICEEVRKLATKRDLDHCG